MDEIKKVGPGGHFVSSRHTRKYMRTEQFQPRLSNRDTRDQWQAAGAEDACQRASRYAEDILAREAENVLPEDIGPNIDKRSR